MLKLLFKGNALRDAQPMEADECRSNVLGTPTTKYEPRGVILYRLEKPAQVLIGKPCDAL